MLGPVRAGQPWALVVRTGNVSVKQVLRLPTPGNTVEADGYVGGDPGTRMPRGGALMGRGQSLWYPGAGMTLETHFHPRTFCWERSVLSSLSLGNAHPPTNPARP